MVGDDLQWAMAQFLPPVRILDVRDLPAPEPMVRIHEALSALPANGQLIAHTPLRPQPLLDWLSREGFRWRVVEHRDGAATVWIQTRAAGD